MIASYSFLFVKILNIMDNSFSYGLTEEFKEEFKWALCDVLYTALQTIRWMSTFPYSQPES